MIYVFEGGSIVFDGTTISEEQRNKAIAIEVLPEKEIPKGKQAILKADKLQEKVWWVYEDLPVDEDVVRLENEIQGLQMAIAELSMMMLGGV